MKRLSLIVVLFSLVGCYDDAKLWEAVNDHESRISTLEELCKGMNSDISSLKTLTAALQNNDYVTEVTPVLENGKEIGYTIEFAKSSPITVYHGKDGQNGQDGKDGEDGQNGQDGKDGQTGTPGQDGKDGYTPVIGVRSDADGTYFWTLDGEWITDDSGNKIPTTGPQGKPGEDGSAGTPGADGAAGAPGADGKDGVTPQLKVEEGYWYVSYDAGTSWTQLGKAVGNDGDSFFRSVVPETDGVVFTLADGTEIRIPKMLPLTIEFNTESVLVLMPNSTLDINYTVTSALPDVEVEALSSGDVTVLVIPDETDAMKGVIRLEASDNVRYAYTKVVVLVSNGERVVMKTIKFEDERLGVSDGALITVPAAGGIFDLPYLANVDSTEIWSSGATWLTLVTEPQTRAYSERKISFQAEPNTEHYRRASIKLLSPYRKYELNYIIEQDGEKALTEEALEAELVKCWETQYFGQYTWQTQLNEYLMFASALIAWKDNRISADYIQCYNLTLNADNYQNVRYYKFFYDAVSKCNELIEILDKSQVEQSVKDEVEAEARFIRGWMYFSLVRLYGDVPLLLDNPEDINALDLTRVAYPKVYQQVLADLEFAEECMRSSARQAEIAGDHLCRPHKWAATAMKSLVYTQIACLLENQSYHFFDRYRPGREPDFTPVGISSADDAWIMALNAAESVINCGEYALAADYADLFDWGAGKPVYQNKERILVLQNGNTSGFPSNTAIRTLPPYWNSATKNNNHGRIRPSRFPVVKWCRVHGGDKYSNSYGLDGLYQNCHDPRFDVSYIYYSYTNQSTGKIQAIYPKTQTGLTNSSYYLPYFKKYSDSEYDVTPGYADMYMIRLAEMYLIAAEAAASLSSGPGDAYWQKSLDYMEVLHARARHSGATHETSPSMSNWTLNTKEDLVNAIMWERVFELHGEGCHEFFDTHRRGAIWMAEWLTKPLNEFHQEPEQLFDNNGRMNYSYFSRYWQSHIFPEDYQELRKSLLVPIPQVVILGSPQVSADQLYNDFQY